MANYKVAWVLLTSYIVLLGLCLGGLYVMTFFDRDQLIPSPPKINITLEELSKKDDFSPSPIEREELQNYQWRNTDFAKYFKQNLEFALVIPMGLAVLLTLPIILGGLCSRSLFSSSVGLNTSFLLWILNLAGAIIFYYNNIYYDYMHVRLYGFDAVDVICITQGGIIALLTLQIILGLYELHRQVKWCCTIRLGQIFTFNTVILLAEIVLACNFVINFFDPYSRVNSLMKGLPDTRYIRGLPDPRYIKLRWTTPLIKFPEYIVYPTAVGISYCFLAPVESLWTRLLGFPNRKMLVSTTLMSSLICLGICIIVQPAIMFLLLSTYQNMPYLKGRATLLFSLFFIHVIITIIIPETLDTSFYAMFRNFLEKHNLLRGFDEKVHVYKKRLGERDALYFNGTLLVLSPLALLMTLCNYRRLNVGNYVMLIGDVIILSRVLPSVVNQVASHHEEPQVLQKIIIEVLPEFIILMVGVCMSMSGGAYGTVIVALLLNILVLIVQFYRIFVDPAELIAQKAKQSVTKPLISEEKKQEDTSVVEEEEEMPKDTPKEIYDDGGLSWKDTQQLLV